MRATFGGSEWRRIDDRLADGSTVETSAVDDFRARQSPYDEHGPPLRLSMRMSGHQARTLHLLSSALSWKRRLPVLWPRWRPMDWPRAKPHGPVSLRPGPGPAGTSEPSLARQSRRSGFRTMTRLHLRMMTQLGPRSSRLVTWGRPSKSRRNELESGSPSLEPPGTVEPFLARQTRTSAWAMLTGQEPWTNLKPSQVKRPRAELEWSETRTEAGQT